MADMDMGNNPAHPDPDESEQQELERLLLHGLNTQGSNASEKASLPPPKSPSKLYGKEEDEDEEVIMNSDVQGALGLYAEATQDAATASVELALGRHFACADYCNQVAEKAAQAVSLLHQGHRAMYNHDLRALGIAVGAPVEIQDAMAILTPFHPEAFYTETPPEEADEVVSPEQASEYIQLARQILRWARGIIL
jgi:HEPN domain-containing protein